MRVTADIIRRFKMRWQLLLMLEVVLFALSPGVLTYFLFGDWLLGLGIFISMLFLVLTLKKPWKISLNQTSDYLDKELETLAFSSNLLLIAPENLSDLAQLQQQRAAEQLQLKISSLKPKTDLFRAILSLISCFIIGISIHYFIDSGYGEHSAPKSEGNQIVFQSVDSTQTELQPPVIKNQRVRIVYPKYTGKTARTTSDMNIQALKGSRLYWQIGFNNPVDSVIFEFSGQPKTMTSQGDHYVFSKTPDASGFYNFRFKDTLGTSYVSELYSLKMTLDEAPIIEVNGLQDFASFNYDDTKILQFKARFTDDYGIADAYITATVSSGTGESVKFREERIAFDSAIRPGLGNLQLSKKINLDSLNMEPGDELYFYIEAKDLKEPDANISRSETYFAVIKDTVSYDYAVEGTLGVDQMPDYFRSQRQLIIDTEKLIKNKPKLSKKVFETTSNGLGAEQNALRMKYGKFMGDEAEGAEEEHVNNEENNPIADYMHKHDGSNEHNLVEQDTEQSQNDSTSADNPDHFTQSLHTKMRLALNEMWDSELHLRVNEPQQSLPYQHRALELLQEIKNAARIYVHRIGFDPPPIKENNRLSGETGDVINFSKQERLEQSLEDAAMRDAVAVIAQLLVKNKPVSDENRLLFKKAGNELAQKALEQPGDYLSTLQQLKWLAERKQTPSKQNLNQAQSGILKALAAPENTPSINKANVTQLDSLLLQELNVDD